MAFRPKWQIALAQILALQAEGLPPAPVGADAAYAAVTQLRDRLTEAGIPYMGGVKGETTGPGPGALAPQPFRGRSRPPTRVRRTAHNRPVSLRQLATELPAAAWHVVSWREGTRRTMRSRFARGPHPAGAPRYATLEAPAGEWLLIEWPPGGRRAPKYWLIDAAGGDPHRRPRPARQSCSGASSGILRNSRTNSGWIISKAGAGAASIITALDYNLLFRWFVGPSMEDPVWDPTVFTKNQERLLRPRLL